MATDNASMNTVDTTDRDGDVKSPEIGVNLIGDLTMAAGLSEATCSTLDAILLNQTPVSYTELRYQSSMRAVGALNPAYQILPSGSIYPVNLMFYNIDVFFTLSAEKLAAITGNKYTIAFWFWELSRLPLAFCDQVKRVDEIWVASRYSQTAMLTEAQCPVTVIPVPVEVKLPTINLSRSFFKIPEERYVFFYNFSATSSDARKNPWGVIEAFDLAFGSPDRQGPLLVIKAHHLARFPELQIALRAAVARVNGILIEESYTREQMNALLNCANVYVSLHRAEGFGLGMAESMYLGKPVIGTMYSSNADFMDNENSYEVGYRLRRITTADHRYAPHFNDIYQPGQVWAEPDVRQAALWMQHLYEHPDQGRQHGQHAAADIRSFCSPAVVGKLIEQRLEQIVRQSVKR